jgi:hypothetical protein
LVELIEKNREEGKDPSYGGQRKKKEKIKREERNQKMRGERLCLIHKRIEKQQRQFFFRHETKKQRNKKK